MNEIVVQGPVVQSIVIFSESLIKTLLTLQYTQKVKCCMIFAEKTVRKFWAQLFKLCC